MIRGIRKAVMAGAWPADLQRMLYRRQLQLLLVVSLPLMFCQGWEVGVAKWWWVVMSVVLTGMLLGSLFYKHLPSRVIPLLMLLFLGMQVLLRLLMGQGLDATATVCLLMMMLVTLSGSVLVGLIGIVVWAALLLVVPLWQPDLPWQNLLAVNLLMFCVALMLVGGAARLRIAMHDLSQRCQWQADQLQQSTLSLTQCHEQNSGLLERMEQRVEQRTTQLQLANRKLVEANSQLESFNYMVSHDMRASLRVMDGFAKVLRDDLDYSTPAAIRQYLDRIQTSIRHMHGMVVELLKLSKSSNTVITRRRINLSAVARELLHDLKILEPGRYVDVVIAEEVFAAAEPALMREVLRNLLTNAWKFTARRSVARIEFGVSEDQSGKIYYVHDNGAGFDMRGVAQLFKPFSRLHTEQDFEGTGVGLAAVKRIIERHGGRAWATGTPHRGAKFYFTLGETAEQSSAAEDFG